MCKFLFRGKCLCSDEPKGEKMAGFYTFLTKKGLESFIIDYDKLQEIRKDFRKN